MDDLDYVISLGQLPSGERIFKNPVGDDYLVMREPPCPRAPEVEAMLRDGWVWTGWSFERDQAPEFGPPVVILVETPVTDMRAPVFVRTGPADDPRLGQFRTDDDGGSCVPAKLCWVSRSYPSPDTAAQLGLSSTNHAMVRHAEAKQPGRYADRLSDRRVLSGRYVERLPTNRKRKRERAKAARRQRKENG